MEEKMERKWKEIEGKMENGRENGKKEKMERN